MGDVVVIDRVEDNSYQGKDFKKVTTKDGKVFNVKYGRGGLLKDKWGQGFLYPSATAKGHNTNRQQAPHLLQG